MTAPDMPSAQIAHPTGLVTNHDDLIKFLASQQRQINLLKAYQKLMGSGSDARLQAIPDSPKAEEPLLAVGQQWRRRDGKVVTIERFDCDHQYGDTHPYWAEDISYTSKGFCGASACIPDDNDLIELVKQSEQVELPSSGLQWTENRQPNEECRYNRCIAETPFGRFLITWKGWKTHDDPTVDETPWGDWYGVFNSVDAAKAACQREFDVKVKACAALST
jgi:hypothetical protein